MKRQFTFLAIIILVTGQLFSQVHTTYLWHLQQPNYWAEQSLWDSYHYQTAWESYYLKNNNGNWYSDGLQHPLNDLQEIFSKEDRKAVYQYRTKDAVQSLLGHLEGGAQVNYSGCLIENVNSLANAGQWGYATGWENNYITARGWQTSGGNPRMDVVGFTFHHALSPLLSEAVLRKQIQAHRHIYNATFGSNPNYSKGYWPAECSFSERIIKVLSEEGFEWSVIANSHLARTLADYPLTFGTSGCNYDPPNGADISTFTGNNWWSGQIDGRGGTFAAPFCYQAHKAKYVDPETGSEYVIDVVPMADLLSYKNGFALQGTGEIDAHIAPYNDPAQPSIVLLAHDGDNAWGGGFDYYNNSVPGFANAAAAQGYVPTTIQQFLDDHPVPANDLVHVEDGSWVNAANDWGHPQFINWLWPMYTTGYEFDPNGWTEDARNWAVLVAAENRVLTADNLSGGSDIDDIVFPDAASSLAERAWHHLLPGYTSGYMYYGTSLDMEVKQSLACNLATGFADQVISANAGTDNTPPTVFIPQRYPYNPGGIGFGPTYGYQQHQNSSDFTVWTFAYDVSGFQEVVLKYRLDNDGVNPLTDNDNDTYAGGPGVQGWNSINMTERIFPTGNITGNPDINFFILPNYIANEYYAEVTGLSDTLVDYFVEATDTYGNTFKSPIQHVFVGTYNGGSGGGNYGLSWEPAEPDNHDMITITITDPASAPRLHWGVNNIGSNWQTPNNVYWPSGSYLFNGSGPAIETPFEGPNAENEYSLQLGPFNNPAQDVQSLAFVIHFLDDTWDNNNGNDYHIVFDESGIYGVVWQPSNPTQFDTVTIYVGQAAVAANLHWGVNVAGSHWTTPNVLFWPTGSFLFNGSGPAIQSPFSGPNAQQVLSINVGPFNNPLQTTNGVDFVISYSNGSWDNNNGNDYYIPITHITPIELDLKVILEGPFNGTTMNNGLPSLADFPSTQPFYQNPWNYPGNESLLSIPPNTVDWLLVEIRDALNINAANETTRLSRQAALLLNDGSVKSTDGLSNLFFNNALNDQLFVVIYHRNHLPIISNFALTESGGIYPYNFSTSSAQAYNSGQKEIAPGVWALKSGDANASGMIDTADKSIEWENETGSTSYSSSDLNLDTQINNLDKNDFWLPNLGEGSQIPE